MRKFLLLIAGMMILISQPAAACVMDGIYPDCSDRDTIEKALNDAGLDADFNPQCGTPVKYPYEDNTVDVFLVRYGQGFDGHCGTDKDVQMLRLPDGSYHAFHAEHFNSRWLNNYFQTHLNTPFDFMRNYPYISAKDYITESVYKKDEVLCLGYDLKYPFQGHVERCQEKDATQLPELKGKVSYVPGLLTWDEARQEFEPECEKHVLEDLNCKINNSYSEDISHWGSNNPTLMFLKDGKLDFYLFINGSFDVHDPKNSPGKIAVKVFADGSVQSKPVLPDEIRNYTIRDAVLKVSEEDFSASTPKGTAVVAPAIEAKPVVPIVDPFENLDSE